MKPKRKKAIIIASILLLVLVACVTYYFATTIRITGVNAAIGASSVLEKLSAGEGTYYPSKTCSMSTASCTLSETQTAGTRPQGSAWAALAYTGLYRATKNDEYLAKARLAADSMIASCKAGSSTDCDWSLVQLNEVYKETNRNDYKEFILERTGGMPYHMPPSKDGSPMLQAVAARQYAISYGLSKINRFIDNFKEEIEGAESASLDHAVILFKEGTLDVRGDDCWIATAKLEAHKAFNDSAYLNEAKTFFDAAMIEKHTADFGVTTQLIPCIEGLKMLSDATGDKKYLDGAVKLNGYVMTYYWDPAQKKKYDGDGSFVSLPCVSNATGIYCLPENVKTVTDNSFIIYTLTTTKPLQKYAVSKAKQIFSSENIQRYPTSEFATNDSQSNASTVTETSWVHFDDLYTLKVFEASDFNGFYVTYYTDINDPLYDPVLKLDGIPSGTLKVFGNSEMDKRQELQYSFTLTGIEHNQEYSIELESKNRNASITYNRK